MQYKFFTVSVVDGAADENALNVFLRSHKIIDVEKHLVQVPDALWSFCISFLPLQTENNYNPYSKKEKIDYKEVLDEAAFVRFVRLREIRKEISEQESIPAYAVFTNEELSEIAKLENVTKSSLLKIQGIGEKRVEKYGDLFIKAHQPKSEDISPSK